MTVTLDLPDDVHELAARWAAKADRPVEGFLTEAVCVTLAGLQVRGDAGLADLRDRLGRADYAAALEALDAVPDVPPDPWDTWDEDAAAAPADLTRPAP